MRIQHNIMAMSAYRNYTNNVSAMKKNLEKLSSGYKINRAGDDAAGLAISEKMRAQITGLETAQKNAKDGISLVQTAEGALTEVHDMLNRMVELATMSANGTYDNTTDRAQLQKEMDQLNDEINRIADSANFNGIKLLDGSMDANGYVHGTGTPEFTSKVQGITVPAATANPILGTDTILHTGAATGSTGTEFSVDLHDVKFDAKKGDTMTISLGSGTSAVHIRLTATADATKALTADDITKAIAAGSATGIKVEYGVGSKASAATYATPAANGKIQINGSDFTLKAANGRLSFQQDAIPDVASKEVLGGMKVTVSNKATKQIEGGIATATIGGAVGAAGATAAFTYNFDGIESVQAGTYKVTVGGKEIEIEITASAANAADTGSKAAQAIASAVAKAYTALASDAKFADGMASKSVYTVAASAGVLTFKASAQNTATKTATVMAGDVSIATTKPDRTSSVSGDYNTQTTDVKNVAFGGDQRLASTNFTLTKDMVVEGGAIIIGNTEYTFSTASADKASENGKVYIGDMVDDKGVLKDPADLGEIARRISNSAKGNTTWTVGVAGSSGKITLVEKTDAAGKSTGNAVAMGNNGKDLSTKEGIEMTLGYKGVDKDADPGEAGSALTLQIGDTADPWNQLKVNIQDMHADQLGKDLIKDKDGNLVLNDKNADAGLTLDSIRIDNQADAAKAVDVIKRAINQVSDLRGTLGATQNRLDHTINNLSVMTENIQDAESTIRDVDVAEEMMAYTKNNILIQSAQAMLAQANQVPQGVLQLLQ